MRIGLFTDTYYPQISGVATSVSALRRQLLAYGHTVYIFTTTDPMARETEPDIFRIPSLPFVSKRRIGIRYPGLKKTVRSLGLELIHTHTEFSLGQLGRQMADELGIPLVHTMHTIYEEYTHYIAPHGLPDTVAKSAVKRLVRSFCNLADAVIVPTEKTYDLLNGYGVFKEISVIPTGIELDKFSPAQYEEARLQACRASLGLRKHDRVLLYIGRISEEKNIEELLGHIKAYGTGKTNLKFLLIGDGPAREKLEAKASAMGLDDMVIFGGQRPQSEIGLYYQLGDVFLSASQSETQGLTYIEAMAAGLPVIAKADPCLDGILKNGVEGYTFRTRADFLDAMDRVLTDEALRLRMSNAASAAAVRFSAQHFGRQVLSLYYSVMTQGKAAEYRNYTAAY